MSSGVEEQVNLCDTERVGAREKMQRESSLSGKASPMLIYPFSMQTIIRQETP